MNEITTAGNNSVRTIDNVSILTNGDLFNRLQVLASVMANSGEMVPEHFRQKPDSCMAVAMQAARWGMDPFAVAQKTHIVGGTLGYEAQLVSAILTSTNAIKGRFHFDYIGDWSKCTRSKEITVEKPARGGGTYKKTERVRAWTDADEDGLAIRVGAVIWGETEITWSEPLYFSNVVIRNSPLWVSNPKQQIAYLAQKYWARLYCSSAILGVYTPDELEERIVKDITPPADRVVLSELVAAAPAEPAPTKATSEAPAATPVPTAPPAEPKIAQQLRDDILQAETPERATEMRALVEEKKADLGISLYTELKNKAVQRFHQLNAMAAINAKFDELSPDSPDAAAQFNALLALINKSQRHLDPTEFERFSMAAADMRAEYGV